MLTCIVCGKEIEENPYKNATLCGIECHYKKYWDNEVKRKNETIRIKGKLYSIDENLKDNIDSKYGNKTLKIRIIETKEEVEVKVWFKGLVPEEYCSLLPDNAILLGKGDDSVKNSNPKNKKSNAQNGQAVNVAINEKKDNNVLVNFTVKHHDTQELNGVGTSFNKKNATSTNDKVIVSQVKNRRKIDIPDMTAEIKRFIKTLTDAESDYRWHEEQVNVLDKKTQDLLHSLELEDLNVSQRSKLATELRNVRRDRRMHKDVVEATQPIVEFLQSEKGKNTYNLLREVQGRTRKIEEYHKNRIYVKKVR